MTIQIEYEAEREWEIDYRPIIEEIVVAALDYEKCPYEAEVNVVLTNDEEIHRINKEFRGIDRATDVLSFPMGDYDVPSDFERRCDIISKNQIQICFDQLSCFYLCKTRVRCQDLLCHCHSHDLFPPAYTYLVTAPMPLLL